MSKGVWSIDYNLAYYRQYCCDSAKTMFYICNHECLFSILIFQFFSIVIRVRSDDEIFDKRDQVLEHSMEHCGMIAETDDMEYHKMERLMSFHKNELVGSKWDQESVRLTCDMVLYEYKNDGLKK